MVGLEYDRIRVWLDYSMVGSEYGRSEYGRNRVW